jgi:hypothetical protein
VQRRLGGRDLQRLEVGVDRDELDALDTGLDHAVDGVDAGATDTDDADHGAADRPGLVEAVGQQLGARVDILRRRELRREGRFEPFLRAGHAREARGPGADARRCSSGSGAGSNGRIRAE